MRITAGLLALLFVSCTSFRERHYFQVKNRVSGEANYYRVTITGSGGWSRLRYVSGYYDERAVDLYFNEIRTPSTGNDHDIQPLFVAGQTSPGTTDTIKPLDPTTRGALLMVLSSNPNAVVDTIGQFAENQQVADALTNIFNREEVRDLRSRKIAAARVPQRFAGIVTELDAYFAAVPATDAKLEQKKAINETYLDVLQTIAIKLGGDGQFANVTEAEAWFKARRKEGQ